MKWIAAIMAFFILFLAVQPGIELLAVQQNVEDKCCKDSCNDKEVDGQHNPSEKKEDDCCGDFCNPFQACCTHIALNATKTTFSYLKIVFEDNSNKFIPHNASVRSQYECDFWQPPRTV